MKDPLPPAFGSVDSSCGCSSTCFVWALVRENVFVTLVMPVMPVMPITPSAPRSSASDIFLLGWTHEKRLSVNWLKLNITCMVHLPSIQYNLFGYWHGSKFLTHRLTAQFFTMPTLLPKISNVSQTQAWLSYSGSIHESGSHLGCDTWSWWEWLRFPVFSDSKNIPICRGCKTSPIHGLQSESSQRCIFKDRHRIGWENWNRKP